jgi:DNA repair protein RecN (Recombination protein N)
MLTRLKIRDLAIIDELTLDVGGGFTALTGETGAGKSIIIGAMNLVLGERASSDDVRTGCDQAVVEALFDIEGHGPLRAALDGWSLGDGNELVIRREISAQGRSRCLVNGRLAPLGQLKSIGDLLADLHGQHQHQSLLKVELHREIVDAFGGPELLKSLEAYGRLYARHGEVVRRLDALDRDEREVARQKDLLEYQVREIGEAGLEPGEDDALEEDRRRLQHADVLLQNAASARDLLFEGEVEAATVDEMLSRCEKLLAESARLDPSLQSLEERLTSARVEIDDIASTLRSYADGLEHDPARLQEVEDRVHLLGQLKKKYGATIGEILEQQALLEEELHALTHSREEQERLEEELGDLVKKLARSAEELSKKRKKAGEKFTQGICSELKELEMPGVRFEVKMVREEDDRGIPFPGKKRYVIHEAGVDHVEFLISPNEGEDLKPLKKIASGGELSRIMLALKVLMRSLDQVPTLVFDEIDTGISGKTGARIGQKMAALGGHYQVICITHLPQIAVKADEHFAVRKVKEKHRTLTRVERLGGNDRLAEIARLLGGKADSPIARKHAGELMAEG